MHRSRIEAEIRRLSPWYYRYELGGVATDITPGCDAHGHRVAFLPDVARRYLADATVLDAACNEGGYSFAALECGAREVTGFDVRAINVEKARFVAEVRGETRARFEVASCDDWLARNPKPVDYVFLCGLLYHLVEPWRTIDEYTRLARRGVFLTCVLTGGDDGYTPFPEAEGIAASADPSLMSQMPNTSRTIMREFVRNGFLPVLVGENRVPRADEFWGGCSLFFRRCDQPLADAARVSDGPAELQLVPGVDGELDVMLYNWEPRPLDAVGELAYEDERGQVLGAPARLEVTLPARVAAIGAPSSESRTLSIPAADIPADTRFVRATLRSPGAETPWVERYIPLKKERP